jgi:hypothetical protein
MALGASAAITQATYTILLIPVKLATQDTNNTTENRKLAEYE